jgi:hypothetical protein
MAFCGNCGAQMDASERFCVKCGKDNSVKAATAPVAAVPPPAPPAPPVAPAPAMYAAPPAGIPVAVGLPPQAPAKKSGSLSTIVVLALLAGGGYYYYTHQKPATPTPTPQSQPQPGPGSGPSNADLAKQQDFEATWQNVNGMVQLSSETWKNNASVSVQSATLECDQLDSGKNVLDEMRTTLNGPVAPGATDGFSPFSMGAIAANVNSVKCTIVHVKPVAQ